MAAANQLHLSAAFRSSRRDECYIFAKDQFVVLNYAPGAKKDELLSGPTGIKNGLHILAKTPFESGIDCAFDIKGNEAYIFSGDQCAKIDYAPHTTKPKMLSGPMEISAMFPFLKGTGHGFESGLDAAIKTANSEVFIFKGDRFAHIDYASDSILTSQLISEAFPSWVGTVFENGLDAAFASHITGEAYIFKGEYWARINYAPGTVGGDFIVDGRIKRIKNDWTSLVEILEP